MKRDDVHKIRFIRRAKDPGFKLLEIDDFLARTCQRKSVCRDVRNILRETIEQNRIKMHKLERQTTRMKAALSHWQESRMAIRASRYFAPSLSR